MKQTIDVKGHIFEYDKDELVKQVEELEWNEDEFGYNSMDRNDESQYNTSEKEFPKLKSDFIKEINSPKFEELIQKRVNITKKGTLSQNRRNIILESGLCYGCHAPYGSFFYYEYVIKAEGNKIILDQVKQNQSF